MLRADGSCCFKHGCQILCESFDFVFLYGNTYPLTSDATHDFLGGFIKHDRLLTFPLIHSQDRKSTRLNSSHVAISYAVFCLKKKKTELTSKCLETTRSL